MVTVSIIVPVYNVRDCLRTCIKSILSQSLKDYELILVDDGSTDGSGEICDEYMHIDKRVTVIHSMNGGVSSARNVGLNKARGEYILFIDSDDYVAEDYVERLVLNACDCTICGFETRDEFGKYLWKKEYEAVYYHNKALIDFSSLYCQYALFSPYCKLFSRRIIMDNRLRFSEQVSWGEDGMFVADYLQYVDSIRVIKDKGYYYIKYRGKETLSTRIREEIADTISTSREHCIEKMKKTAPHHYQKVKEFCIEDIKQNCAYFLSKLICESNMRWQEQEKVLSRFLENPYILQVLESPKMYFPSNLNLQKSLRKKKAIYIIWDYMMRCKAFLFPGEEDFGMRGRCPQRSAHDV